MRRVYSPLMNSDILITRERNSLFGRKAENRQKKSFKKNGYRVQSNVLPGIKEAGWSKNRQTNRQILCKMLRTIV